MLGLIRIKKLKNSQQKIKHLDQNKKSHSLELDVFMSKYKSVKSFNYEKDDV